MLTVHELRKRGYQVQVRHNRCFEYGKNGISGLVEQKPLSKGGATEIRVTRPEEVGVGKISAVGVAECSPKENFSRKRGVRIALGRALKHLGLPTK